MAHSPSDKAEKYILIDACQLSGPYNYCLLDGLANLGANVTYATAEFPHEERPDPPGITTLRCFFLVATFVSRLSGSTLLRRVLRAAEYPLNVAFLIGYILANGIRTVHFMWSLSPAIDLWLYRLLQLWGRRVVYTAHNAFPHESDAGKVKKYTSLYRTVDHIIVLTEYTANEIRKVCPDLPQEKISVIPHGDFGPLFEHYPCNEKLAAEVLKKAAGRKIVAFLGLIRPYKGLEYLIESFPLIKQRMPNAFLLVGGSVAIGNQQQIESAIEANCDSGETWVDLRYLPTPDLKAFVSVMDVLVMPYVAASQSGNTVMAYSAGVPVVATNVGGLGEMTDDNVTGFVIPPRDPEAIADAVCKCFGTGQYERLSTQSRQVAAEKFGWKRIAEQTIAAYKGPDH